MHKFSKKFFSSVCLKERKKILDNLSHAIEKNIGVEMRQKNRYSSLLARSYVLERLTQKQNESKNLNGHVTQGDYFVVFTK